MKFLESTVDTSVQAQRVGTAAACTALRFLHLQSITPWHLVVHLQHGGEVIRLESEVE